MCIEFVSHSNNKKQLHWNYYVFYSKFIYFTQKIRQESINKNLKNSINNIKISFFFLRSH